jgi:hypothetical protein
MLLDGNSSRDGIRHFGCSIAAFAVVLIAFAGCASSEPRATAPVVVAPLTDTGAASETGMTRAELEAHVRRFADRYLTRVVIASNALIRAAETEHQRRRLEAWKNVSHAAVVEVAIGPDAMTNLFDMMTLTMLGRLVVEEHWAPEIIEPAAGKDAADQFLQAYRDLEEDIWTIADDVLSAQHQADLKALIHEWRRDNPDQIFPWYVRLSNFSGQRAASLDAVRQSGGMLQEVARARETAEEIQAFAERVLFYLQRAPVLTSNEFEASVNDVLASPEIEALIRNVDRLTATVEGLPETRLAAIDQLMDRLGEERVALLQGMAGADTDVRQVLTELRPIMESLERIVLSAKDRSPDSRPFDINEYRALVAESAQTAAELRMLADSVDGILQNGEQLHALIDEIIEEEVEVVDRIFYLAIAFVFVFFALLLVYNLVAARIVRK